MTTSTTTKPGQVNTATAIMGPTGAGKSSLVATAAEYVWETHKQVTLLYSASGGGFPAKVQSLVRLGVIWAWRMRTRGEPFETCMRASQGWWPRRIDLHSGETEPYVQLAPPITTTFTMFCPEGHVVKSVPVQALLTPQLCPTCKKMTDKTNMRVQQTAVRTKGFEPVGAVAFDDITSMLEWQMNDMASRHARQEIKGEETALGGRITSGDMTLGGNNRSHYGFVQTRASEMVHNSHAIPFLSIPPIWTALMLETVDEGGLPVKGMKLAGKAKTDEAGSWFGNMLEVGVVPVEGSKEHVRRLWLNEYIDEGNYRHLIKHRGTPRMPDWLEDTPGDPWGQVNLGVFFRMLEADVAADADATAERLPDAPGLPEGMAEFGTPVTERVETPAGVQAPKGGAAPIASPPKAGPPRPAPKAPAKPRTMPAAVPAVAAAPVQEAAPVAAPSEESRTAVEAVATTDGTQTSPSPAEVPPSVPEPPAPAPPVQAAPPAPAPRPQMAPPPGPRPPAAAPRRPTPRPVPVPVAVAKP
jgi:hypothetical protein